VTDEDEARRAAAELDALIDALQAGEPTPLPREQPRAAARLAADLGRLADGVRPDAAFAAELGARLRDRAAAGPAAAAPERREALLVGLRRWPLWAVTAAAVVALMVAAPAGRHALLDGRSVVIRPVELDTPAPTEVGPPVSTPVAPPSRRVPTMAVTVPVIADLAVPSTPRPHAPATPAPTVAPVERAEPQPSPRLKPS
jgi:hypothetical protein